MQDVSPLPANLRSTERRVDVPCGSIFRKDAKVKSNSDANSLAKIYFQIGKERHNAKETGLVHLFSAMLDAELSQKLRTKENLGYFTRCEAHFYGGINGLSLTVVSPVRDPTYLLTRIDDFMGKFPMHLEAVDDSYIRNYKRSVRSNLPDNSGDDIWDQVNEKRYMPGFYSKVKRQVKKLEKADLIQFHEIYFSETSSQRRKALICIWGCNTVFPAEPVTGNEEDFELPEESDG